MRGIGLVRRNAQRSEGMIVLQIEGNRQRLISFPKRGLNLEIRSSGPVGGRDKATVSQLFALAVGVITSRSSAHSIGLLKS